MSIEVAIARPHHKYPWVAVIQSDEGEFAWGLFSQGRTTKAFATGRAATIEQAETAARFVAAVLDGGASDE